MQRPFPLTDIRPFLPAAWKPRVRDDGIFAVVPSLGDVAITWDVDEWLVEFCPRGADRASAHIDLPSAHVCPQTVATAAKAMVERHAVAVLADACPWLCVTRSEGGDQ